MAKPIILLDVDGVLNPCPFKAERSPGWAFEPTFRSNERSGRWPLNVSKEMAQELLSITDDIRWLTTWCDQAHPNIGGPVFGWPEFPVLQDHRKFSRNFFWKPANVQDVTREPGPPVIWIDDDSAGYVEACTLESLDPHGRLLVITPECDIGLTREHFARIREWLADRELTGADEPAPLA